MRTARTPQGAVGWVVFLVSMPYLALPAYLFLGHSRFPGYVSARRDSEQVIRAVQRLASDHPARIEVMDPERQGHALAFERIAEFGAVSGNAADLLIDGDATFDAIFEAIDGASSYVLVAFYILRDDDLGRALQSRLIAKARAGCMVRVLYDALGSQALPGAYLAALREAGAEVWDFHNRRQPRSRFQMNFRNHRKIVVADGRVAFVGGLNVGDEYMSRDPNFGHWRDTHLRLAGPVVAQVQLVFAEDWHWATGEQLKLDWRPDRQAEDLDAVIVAPGPADRTESGSFFFCNAIGAARRRVWIASPYFVPDIDVLTALKLAALRGVDVRVIVADKRDHWLVWLAAFAYFDEVREAGVKIHRYADGFMHQKVVLVDDQISAVGTINLDIRSCRLNFEISSVVFGPEFAARVEAMLERDLAQSYLYQTPLDAAPRWLIRNGAPVARLFAPLL